VGLLELIEQKSFLGPEFLTWLWHRSELENGRIELESDDPVEVVFEDAMMLEAEIGHATVQTLRGEAPGASAESRAALMEGKKVKRAKLHLTQGEMEWTFTLRADTFDFSGVRIPAPKGLPFEEGVSLRLQAVERLFALVDRLYAAFLAIRLDPQAWDAELARIHKWVEDK
jgi:hypothetical protein